MINNLIKATTAKITAAEQVPKVDLQRIVASIMEQNSYSVINACSEEVKKQCIAKIEGEDGDKMNHKINVTIIIISYDYGFLRNV